LLNWIELSCSALRHNVRSLAKLARGRTLAVVVKANAYGHGLPEIVRMLVDLPEVDYVSVHSLEEAAACRESGWDRRIMLLGPVARQRLDAVLEYDLEPVIFDRPTDPQQSWKNGRQTQPADQDTSETGDRHQPTGDN